tara:strand:+ start:147 stop:1688 length:1542 start_codon:yes stop_codon:yes gene_type:complete
MADKLDELFTHIRNGVKLLPAKDLEALSAHIVQTKTENLMIEALEDFKDRKPEDEEWEAFHARTFRQEVLDDLRHSRLDSVKPEVNDWLQTHNLSVKPDSATYKQLCRTVLQALAEVYKNAEIIVRSDFENPRLVFENTTSSTPVVVESAPEASLTFEHVIEKYLQDNQPRWVAKQLSAQKAMLNYYLDYAEDLDTLASSKRTLTSVTTAQVRAYKEHLQDAPSNAKKKYPSLSPRETILAAQADHAPTLSETSINKYLQCLSTLYGFATSELDYTGINPFKGRSSSKAAKTSQRDQRHPFSREQLQRLFSSPLYTGCKSLASCHLHGDLIPNESHKYWTPLIGLLTGMRQQEILQLYLEDIYKKDGIWVFDLNTNHEDKRLKTLQSKRLVPIHSLLIDRGLLKLWQEKQSAGQSVRLFEDAGLSNDGTYSSTFSKWFSRYLQKIDVKTDKTSFHSLRHNMKDFFRDIGESDELAENFMGRSTGSTGEAYGSGFSTKRFYEALHKINFNELLK